MFSSSHRLKTFWLLTFFLITTVSISFAQPKGKHTVSGYVKDLNTGEYLIGANVYIKELLKGTSTNQYGFFSLTLPRGSYQLLAGFIGYEPKLVNVSFDENGTVNILLMPESSSLKAEFCLVLLTQAKSRTSKEAPQAELCAIMPTSIFFVSALKKDS